MLNFSYSKGDLLKFLLQTPLPLKSAEVLGFGTDGGTTHSNAHPTSASTNADAPVLFNPSFKRAVDFEHRLDIK